MPLNLFNVTLNQSSRQYFGSQNRFTDLRRAFRELARDAVDEAAIYCEAGAKSVVPVDTEELRDQMIRRGNQANYTAKVYVTNDIHVGNGHPQAAYKLANILNSGFNERGRFMHRTRDSLSVLDFLSIAAGSPTQNWIRVTDLQVNGGIQRYLNNMMGPRTYG